MMKALDDLREKLCIELDEIAAKKEIGAGDLDAVHKLTDTIKNIDKIIMLEAEEYSQRGSGNSYGHYVRGHYSREGGNSYNGRSYRGSSRRGYSGARGEMREQLEELMNSADSEREREAIRRCLSQIE